MLDHYSDIVSLLDLHGVDMNCTDSKGRKAIDIGIWPVGISEHADIDMNRILRRYGSKLSLNTVGRVCPSDAVLSTLHQIPDVYDGMHLTRASIQANTNVGSL